MALTKNQIVENILAETGFTKKKTASGDDVLRTGSGKFCVKTKNQRKGGNPATGEELMLPSRKMVVCKCSGKLRGRIDK